MNNHSISDAPNDVKSSPLNSRQKFADKWMRIIGSAEGVSFLLLLFVAMPLKYVWKNPVFVQMLGPIHGGLFLLYLASVIAVASILKWRWFYVLLAFLASTFPFGPFIFEAWLHRKTKAGI